MSDASDRQRRFERLERARPEGPGQAQPAVEDRSPEDRSLKDRSVEERFGPARERPPDIDAQALAGDDQPFVRCSGCETDNTRYAATCSTCGLELRTEAQQAYNRKLWAERRAERDEADRQNGERRQAQAGAEAEQAQLRRQGYEEMAREVGRMERDRLDRADGSWEGSGDPYAARLPLVVRFLRFLVQRRWW